MAGVKASLLKRIAASRQELHSWFLTFGFLKKNRSRGSDFQARLPARSLNRRQSGFCKLDRLSRDQRLISFGGAKDLYSISPRLASEEFEVGSSTKLSYRGSNSCTL